MADNYYLKITMEEGKTGADEPYQQTTFVQNYDTHEQQVEEQQQCFNQVAAAVAGSMTAAGESYLESKKPKPVKKGR